MVVDRHGKMKIPRGSSWTSHHTYTSVHTRSERCDPINRILINRISTFLSQPSKRKVIRSGRVRFLANLVCISVRNIYIYIFIQCPLDYGVQSLVGEQVTKTTLCTVCQGNSRRKGFTC